MRRLAAHSEQTRQPLRAAVMALLVVVLAFALAGCGGGASSGGSKASGPGFTPKFYEASFHKDKLNGSMNAGVDASSVDKGYVVAVASSKKSLKFQVSCNGEVYNYDLSGKKNPEVFPLNMGDGYYTFAILQNTTGKRYAQLFSTGATVKLKNEFQPYLRPSQICNYSEDSECVKIANQLTQGKESQTAALQAVYDYVIRKIKYDHDKAAKLSKATGYLPDPDKTLESGTGICFDYASLSAAMLRSIGIPCKVVTGYVMPDQVYHAWNMVYVDGAWEAVKIEANQWSRIDTTFASTGGNTTIGDGTEYTDRYIY